MSAKSPSRSTNKSKAVSIPVARRKSGRKTLWSFLLAGISLFTLYSLLDPIKERFYIFDHVAVHELAQRAVQANGNNSRAIVDQIVSELKSTHGVAIADKEEWVFNNAGGAMGSMYILHASITEYLIVFGTPVGTEGHSGRHTADDYFNILTGEQWAHEAGSLDMEIYPAGSVHHMRRGVVKQYKMHRGCWALELAQGWIPPMMPFGLADTLTSTLDFPTFYHTVRITGREMLRNLLRGKI